MIRPARKILLVALAALFAFGSLAEAAPKKAVRHRARHSSRVSAGTTSPAKKRAAPKRARKSSRRATSQRHQSTKPR